jgi:hypothetical protein
MKLFNSCSCCRYPFSLTLSIPCILSLSLSAMVYCCVTRRTIACSLSPSLSPSLSLHSILADVILCFKLLATLLQPSFVHRKDRRLIAPDKRKERDDGAKAPIVLPSNHKAILLRRLPAALKTPISKQKKYWYALIHLFLKGSSLSIFSEDWNITLPRWHLWFPPQICNRSSVENFKISIKNYLLFLHTHHQLA